MTEWLIEIESAAGVARSAGQLERFALALDEVRGSTGAATSLDAMTGVVSASFAVEATSMADAEERGHATFRAALASIAA